MVVILVVTRNRQTAKSAVSKKGRNKKDGSDGSSSYFSSPHAHNIASDPKSSETYAGYSPYHPLKWQPLAANPLAMSASRLRKPLERRFVEVTGRNWEIRPAITEI
jgi:hypothetical protein